VADAAADAMAAVADVDVATIVAATVRKMARS
jgi:hypothetical protein